MTGGPSAALIAFVRARLDDDERNVPMAGARAWRSGYGEGRLLRDVQADRKILDLLEAAEAADDTSLGVATLRAVVKIRAAIWCGHPLYQQGWQ